MNRAILPFLALALITAPARRVLAQGGDPHHHDQAPTCTGTSCNAPTFTTKVFNPANTALTTTLPGNNGAIIPNPNGTTLPGGELPPGGDPNAPPPLGEKELKAERERLIKLYPTMKSTIKQTLDPKYAQALGITQIKAFEGYLGSREHLNDFIQKYLPRGLTAEQLTAMPRNDKSRQLLGDFARRLRRVPGAQDRYQELANKAEVTMIETLHDNPALQSVVMTADPLSHDLFELRTQRPGGGGNGDANGGGGGGIPGRPNWNGSYGGGTGRPKADDDWVNKQPNSPEPLLYRGQTSMLGGDYSAAINDFSKALALDANNVQALTMRGAARRETGDFAGATQDAARALQLDPNNKGAQNVYAMSAGRGGKTEREISDQGAAAFTAAPTAASSPSSSLNMTASQGPGGSASREAARHFSLGDYEAAAKAAQDAADKNPADQLAAFYLAAARMKLGDAEGALKAADAALALDPKSVALNIARAQALNRLGRYRDALGAASLAAGLNPRDASALVASAEAHAGLKDRAAALDALRRAAELDSRFSPLYASARNMGDEDDLLTLFQKDAAGPKKAKGGGLTAALAGVVGAENVRTVLGAGAVGLLFAVGAALLFNKRRDQAV